MNITPANDAPDIGPDEPLAVTYVENSSNIFLLPDVSQVAQWTFMGIAVLLTLVTGLDYIRKARQVRAFGQLRDEAGLPRPPR